MEALSDGELVRLVAAGDARRGEAEAHLCRRFAPRIRLYGLRHLRDEERARDLVQTVLIGLLEAARAGRVDEPDHVERFVLGTCRHVAGRLREQAARTVTDDEAVLAASVEPREPVDVGALLRCLQTLDARARQVVVWSFHEERGADEIAARLATTAGNVRVLRHRAVESLRRCLDAGRSA